MKRAILASVAMSATLALFGARQEYPTYFKLVITDSGDHGGTCQISQLAFFDADHICVSTNLMETNKLSTASELVTNSFFSATVFSQVNNKTYFDGPIYVIFKENNSKWCFNNSQHGGIGNTSNGNDGTITLVMRLADTAKPVAYNFCSGNDDNQYKNRAFTSWKLYGSVNGIDWQLCSEVSNLEPIGLADNWYNGTITEGNNAGHFPISPVTIQELTAASVAWNDGKTEVSATLSERSGDIYAVFTEVPGGTERRIKLAENVDATSSAQTISATLTTDQLPVSKLYTWIITAEDGTAEDPFSTFTGGKYYSGAADITVRYVATTGNDTNDGLSIEKAKKTLTAAIADLGEDGGTVYIDDGDYAFTSDTDTAVTITNPVHVVGLSRDATKVTITRTGTPKRNFVLNHANCSLEFVTIVGGTLKDDYGTSVSLRNGSVSDCIIRGANCQSWECNGAMYADGNARVVRCIFRENKGWFNGSALKAAGSAIIENCLFTANEQWGGKTNGGGTVYLGGSSRLVNCTITGNVGKESTGVCNSEYGSAVVQNCAIFGNSADSDATGHGHIWWGNSGRFANCAAEGQINDNCYVLAPGFRDAANGDYSLSSASELIDQGLTYSTTAATSATDLAGNAREVDVVDIGCYEYTKNELDVGFSSSIQAGLAPLEVTFTATVFGATGTITYEWDFDNDGQIDETTYTDTVTHIYPKGGLYSIALTIRTEGGATKQAVLLDEVLVSPKVVYADANGANPVFPYDTPATATPCLETAIDTAGNGSTVLVADGTYAATNTVGFVVDKAIRILSISGNPAACVANETAASGFTERRVMTINHASAFVAGVTLQGGYLGKDLGATLNFGTLGGMVSNCVIRGGYVRDWGGSAALAQVTASGVITHSILEDGLALDDYQPKNARPDTCSVDVAGLVANCLIRNFNRQADNQNIVTVRSGGKLLNCTIVDGLCGNAMPDGSGDACFGVVAQIGARIENCAIAGFRHQEADKTFSVRAWRGDASCFVNCATDTESPINESCIKVTTAAFKDFANADYRAAGASSPLVNAGVNNELAEGTDFTCRFRKIGGRMDIGCYEHQANAMVITVR